MLDRCKGELIDFIVGDNRIENAYLLMYRILTNNENKNFNIEYRDTLNTIDYLCTDGHNAYEKVANHPLFKHNIKHHIISKSETCFVESWNSKLRDNLAKLNRDTKRFPKSIKALEDSIYLLANMEFVVGIIF